VKGRVRVCAVAGARLLCIGVALLSASPVCSGSEMTPATFLWSACGASNFVYPSPLSACLASHVLFSPNPEQYYSPIGIEVVPGYEPIPADNVPGKWLCKATAIAPEDGTVGTYGLCHLFPLVVCPANGGWSPVGFICWRNTCPAGQARDPDSGECKPAQKDPPNCSGSDSPESTPWVGNPIHAGKGYKSDVLSIYAGAGVAGLRYRLSYFGGGAADAGAYRPQLAHGSARSTSYERRLAPAYDATPPDGPSVLSASRADGGLIGFTRAGNTYLPDADIVDRVYREADAGGATTGWRYQTAGDETETYSADGKLLALASRAGLPQTLAYDATGRLSGISDGFGRTLNFTYAGNRIAGMSDPGGGAYAFAYDANANLVAVTWPDNTVRQYHYEHATHKNALTGITDELGVRYATYSYDASGRAVAESLAGNVGAHQLAYGSNSTVVTDPLGTARTYHFQTILGVVKSSGVSQPGGAGCGPAAEALTYDANGNIASRLDFNGKKTTYSYDLARNLETLRTEGLDNAGGVLPESRTIATAWHATWRLPVRIDEYAGGAATGSPVRRTELSYDDRGNLSGRTLTDGATGASRSRSTTYTYSPTVPGLILRKVEDGPRTDVADITTSDYYPADAICAGADLGAGRDKGCRGQLSRISNPLGQVTRLTRYNAHGQVEEIVDPNGLVTTLAYDARQRLVSRRVGEQLSLYQYDAAGQLIRLTPPDGAAISYTYDAAHRLSAITDALGNRIAYTLDAAGNRTKEDIFDPQNTLVKTLGRAYDALGRLQTLTGVE